MGVTPKRQLEASGKGKDWSRSSCEAHFLPFPKPILQHEDRVLKWPELMPPEHVVVWYFQPMAVRCGDSYKWLLFLKNCFYCQFKPRLKWEDTWWANNRAFCASVITGVLWGQWLQHTQPYRVSFWGFRVPNLYPVAWQQQLSEWKSHTWKTKVAKFKPCCFFNVLIHGTGQFSALALDYPP